MIRNWYSIYFGFIIIICFPFSGCTPPLQRFDKNAYLKECGISLEGKLLSSEELDSLIGEIREAPFLFKDISRALELFEINRDYESCDSVCFAFSNSFLFLEDSDRIEEAMRNHFLYLGYELSSNAKELLDITLSYAKTAEYGLRKSIGEASFKFAKEINDTLATRCIFRIVEGLSGDDINGVSTETAKAIVKWCKIGIPYQLRAFEHDNYLISSLAEAGYIANDKHADYYADLLFDLLCSNDSDEISDFWKYSDGLFISGGALRKRFYSALEQHDYQYAERILDYYAEDVEDEATDEALNHPEIFDENYEQLDPYADLGRIDEYVRDRMWPEDIDTLTNFTYRTAYKLASILYEGNEANEFGQNMPIALERSRLHYLQKDSTYTDWLTILYFLGIDQTFPSMTGLVDFDEFLSPDYLYLPEVIAQMTYQYNNLDPRSVYDACLYIKGTSDKIPGQIYNAVKKTSNNRIKSYVDSIRAGLEPVGYLTKKDSLLKDSLEVSLTKILSNCLYSWEDVQANLKDNEVALEFMACPSLDIPSRTFYKAALVRNNTEPIVIDLCSEGQLKELIKRGRFPQNGLFDITWEPLQEYLNDGDIIYFSSDGLLNLFNLQAIKDKEGNLLMDKYRMYQVSSTREIIGHEDNSPFSFIALFGGLDYNASFSNDLTPQAFFRGNKTSRSIYRDVLEYLPKSLDEVKAISKHAKEYGIKNACITGDSGTEESFYTTTSHQPDILHIATHGFYYSKTESSYIDYFDKMKLDSPLDRCGLVLSRGNHVWAGESIPEGLEDGILLGSEINRLDLNDVGLVVLSACNTALGDISGEGVSGLRQAFKRAGVKSLLMTLSKVDDEATAFFMTNFYEHLFSGEDKHTAYRAAINTMRNSEKYSDPKYWSSFILVD